jgi:hypothetical protein
LCAKIRTIMFLRQTRRKKDGKTHVYWNIVENRRLDDGRVVQRQVLYLGEIHSSPAAAWRKAIEVFDEASGEPRTLALFPEDRCEAIDNASVVRVCLSALTLRRPRQWGACWLGGQLWRELQLDRFWTERLPPSRKGTRWDQILQVLVAYRLIAPGSEWKLHREWFGNSAMADLLGADFGLAEAHKLYACHDRLLAHKNALFSHLVGRWRDLFNARFDVLLALRPDEHPGLQACPPGLRRGRLEGRGAGSISRSMPRRCRKATSAGMATAATVARIARNW